MSQPTYAVSGHDARERCALYGPPRWPRRSALPGHHVHCPGTVAGGTVAAQAQLTSDQGCSRAGVAPALLSTQPFRTVASVMRARSTIQASQHGRARPRRCVAGRAHRPARGRCARPGAAYGAHVKAARVVHYSHRAADRGPAPQAPGRTDERAVTPTLAGEHLAGRAPALLSRPVAVRSKLVDPKVVALAAQARAAASGRYPATGGREVA